MGSSIIRQSSFLNCWMAYDSKQAVGSSLSRSGCSAVLSGNKKGGKSSASKCKRPSGPTLEKRFELAFDPMLDDRCF